MGSQKKRREEKVDLVEGFAVFVVGMLDAA